MTRSELKSQIERRLDVQSAKRIPVVVAREFGMRSREFRVATEMVERLLKEVGDGQMAQA